MTVNNHNETMRQRAVVV